jgi:SUN domain-containing protein 1/2
VKAWQADKAQRRKEVEAKGGEIPEALLEVPYPKDLPTSPQYMRLNKFSYNIHGSSHIQTFPVDEDVRNLGVDFGIVVLKVKSNWGREEFTCLYRMRVHGQRMGETPLPYPEES